MTGHREWRMSMREKTQNTWAWAVPIMLALGFVPLISTAKQYTSNLNNNNWFSNSSNFVDIFLYWKGQALILLAFIMMAMMICYTLSAGWSPVKKKLLVPELAWLSVYLVFATLSAFLSPYGACALTGGYEQWEGLNVILAYGVLAVYAYMVLDSERIIRYVVYSIIGGSFILGLIGTFQYMGMDLFRGSFGQAIMSLMSENKMKYSFNFPEGWVYATLYNPNYVGSYAALVLPVLVVTAMTEWKKLSRIWTVLSIMGACLMIVTLLGSQSLTGCVGIIAGLVFAAAYRFLHFLREQGWKKILIIAACAGAFAAVAAVLFPKEIQYGMNKLFHPTQDTHITKKILPAQSGLEVTTVEDQVFYVTVTGETSEPLRVRDAEGAEVSIVKDAEQNYYTFTDERFKKFRLCPGTVDVGNKRYYCVQISNPEIDKKWTVAKVGESYQIYNSLGKLDALEEIPAWGFENRQHFGSKRGYIWSRTFPLLKKHLFLGSGPDTFTQEFPNNDYVGKMNMNYDGVPVTKPHNMFLQIWVQTGFVSLAGYLLLFFWYFVKSVKLYWNRPLQTIPERIGFAVMISLFAYMVTGLANDSTVTVAPVYWGMLGLGMAVNRIVRKG